MRDENSLKEKSKGKTREGASELLTMGDLQSHRKMFNLIKNTFPDITVSTASAGLFHFTWTFCAILCLCSLLEISNYLKKYKSDKWKMPAVTSSSNPRVFQRDFHDLASVHQSYIWSVWNGPQWRLHWFLSCFIYIWMERPESLIVNTFKLFPEYRLHNYSSMLLFSRFTVRNMTTKWIQ